MLNRTLVFVLRESPEAGSWYRMHFVEYDDLGMLSVLLGQFGDSTWHCIEQERAD